jgi:hypothetical protein
MESSASSSHFHVISLHLILCRRQFSLAAFPAIPRLCASALSPTETGESDSSSSSADSNLAMPLDLFRDPNLAEVKLIEAPLRFFLARLQALLAEFPAHPILLQLVQVCVTMGGQQMMR